MPPNILFQLVEIAGNQKGDGFKILHVQPSILCLFKKYFARFQARNIFARFPDISRISREKYHRRGIRTLKILCK